MSSLRPIEWVIRLPPWLAEQVEAVRYTDRLYRLERHCAGDGMEADKIGWLWVERLEALWGDWAHASRIRLDQLRPIEVAPDWHTKVRAAMGRAGAELRGSLRQRAVSAGMRLEDYAAEVILSEEDV